MLPNLFSSLASLELTLSSHRCSACWVLLRVDQAPRAPVPLCVHGATEVGIVVLSDPTFEITGLTDVGIAVGIDENVDIVRHERTRKQWLPKCNSARTGSQSAEGCIWRPVGGRGTESTGLQLWELLRLARDGSRLGAAPCSSDLETVAPYVTRARQEVYRSRLRGRTAHRAARGSLGGCRRCDR